jgi:type I restriction enzyme S subunit
LYIVFQITKEKSFSDFLTHFFESDKWHKQIVEISAEGARNHGLLNISSEDFFDIAIKVPKLSEEYQFI